MTNIGGDQGIPWLRTRVALALLSALLTCAFAILFAYMWTDELVDGNDRAFNDPVRTAIEGASAGLVPIIIGTVQCTAVLVGTKLKLWWPIVCVAGAGAGGAVLGVTARFPPGVPPTAIVFVTVLTLVGTVGLIVETRQCRRKFRTAPVGGPGPTA